MPKFNVTQRHLVVAMDHGRAMGAVPGLQDPARVIDTVVEAGADAIMTSFGIIKRFKSLMVGQVSTILRLDGGAFAGDIHAVGHCRASAEIAPLRRSPLMQRACRCIGQHWAKRCRGRKN